MLNGTSSRPLVDVASVNVPNAFCAKNIAASKQLNANGPSGTFIFVTPINRVKICDSFQNPSNPVTCVQTPRTNGSVS